MPQEFLVVQCHNCHVFQVDIAKKVPKWTCKICNTKQSLVKVYSRGTGKDCRLHVQDLNEKRITMETMCELVINPIENENQKHKVRTDNRQNSKWVKFVENEQTSCESFEETQRQLYADNISSKTADDRVVRESDLETQIEHDNVTIEQNALENKISRQELDVDKTENSKWSKFMEKRETSEEELDYDTLLETGTEKELDFADENINCFKFHKYHADLEHNVKSNQSVIKNDSCMQKKKDRVLKDTNVTNKDLCMGRDECPLKRVIYKTDTIDKNQTNNKRKKFLDHRNIFDCDSQYNMESLLDI